MRNRGGWLWRCGAGRELVSDHIHLCRFRDLPKAGRSSIRFGVHVQRLEDRGRALRRILRRAFRHAAKSRHLFGREQLPIVRPTLGSLGGTDLDEAAFVFQNLELFAVFHCRGDRRLGRQFLPQQQRGGSNVGCADGARLALRMESKKPESSKQQTIAARGNVTSSSFCC